MPSRELTEEERKALELNAHAGVQRARIDSGEIKSDSLEGKLAEDLRKKGVKMLEDKGFPLNEENLKIMEEWVADQIKNVSKKREEIRERNLKLIKDFGPGGRFEGRTLDPRAFFKGDEFEEVAMEPGGIADTMAMKSSLPTAISYLAFLQKEGYDIFSGIDYSTVIY